MPGINWPWPKYLWPLFGQFEFSSLEFIGHLAVTQISFWGHNWVNWYNNEQSLVAYAIVEDMFILWGLRHQLVWSIRWPSLILAAILNLDKRSFSQIIWWKSKQIWTVMMIAEQITRKLQDLWPKWESQDLQPSWIGNHLGFGSHLGFSSHFGFLPKSFP